MRDITPNPPAHNSRRSGGRVPKHLRRALAILGDVGIAEIRNGGHHVQIILANGERYMVGRGTKTSPHHERRLRALARRVQRQANQSQGVQI
jgi:hypothetical protein